MKKLITICLLLAASLVSNAQTGEDLAVFNRFVCADDGVCRAYIHAPSTILTNEIPAGVHPWGQTVTVDEAGQTNVVQKTLGEFVLTHLITNLGDGTVVFCLSAMKSPVKRPGPTTRVNLFMWNQFTTPMGHPHTTWLTVDDRAALLPTEDI